MNLAVELAPQHKSGLLLRNPVIMASGTAGYGAEYARSAEVHRLGAFVCSGVTLHAHAGTAQPSLLETPSGLLSAFDRPSPGVNRVLKSHAHTWAGWQTPVIVNLAGACIDDFAALAEWLDSVPGVAALELNLACPDLDGDGAPFSSQPASVARLITSVRQRSALPLIAKLAPFGGDLRAVALAAASAGVDALSLIHALPALSIDLHARQPALAGGLSGPAIKPLALRIFYDVARELRPAYPHLPLIGVGGISNAQDALEFLMAGASAIQAGTITFVNPRASVEIVEGIEAFMRHEGIADLAEIVGMALS